MEDAERFAADISIHAPCTGSDSLLKTFNSTLKHFNPRSLHGERRATAKAEKKDQKFQSTLPARGATHTMTQATLYIGLFQSTLPARGATRKVCGKSQKKSISIHAPCTGSDSPTSRRRAGRWDFNPRSLHGERQVEDCKNAAASAFQSTLPARGATISISLRVRAQSISIHAPCTGSDPWGSKSLTIICLFQSTLPARGATAFGVIQIVGIAISIHAPCTGSDSNSVHRP